LHLVLLSHGIGLGDEVIVPSFTWIATPNSVVMTGATPVFADIELETLNLNPNDVEARITEKTKAIMLVHQFGNPCDLDLFETLAKKYNLILIEDAACALGSQYDGEWIGSRQNDACFSFHPRKVISTGEGGAIACADASRLRHLKVLVNHGASASDLHKHQAGTVEALLSETFDEVGYNYRMSNFQGAVGCGQMEICDELIKKRQYWLDRYERELQDHEALELVKVHPKGRGNGQSMVVRVVPERTMDRNQVAQDLLDHGIACRPAYMACHVHPAYQNNSSHDLKMTELALNSVLILPLFPQMEEQQFEYIIKYLKQSLSMRVKS
jgi:dTDP-4-amino-4,6-dideoxygalactose transaminase